MERYREMVLHEDDTILLIKLLENNDEDSVKEWMKKKLRWKTKIVKFKAGSGFEFHLINMISSKLNPQVLRIYINKQK